VLASSALTAAAAHSYLIHGGVAKTSGISILNMAPRCNGGGWASGAIWRAARGIAPAMRMACANSGGVVDMRKRDNVTASA